MSVPGTMLVHPDSARVDRYKGTKGLQQRNPRCGPYKTRDTIISREEVRRGVEIQLEPLRCFRWASAMNFSHAPPLERLTCRWRMCYRRSRFLTLCGRLVHDCTRIFPLPTRCQPKRGRLRRRALQAGSEGKPFCSRGRKGTDVSPEGPTHSA